MHPSEMRKFLFEVDPHIVVKQEEVVFKNMQDFKSAVQHNSTIEIKSFQRIVVINRSKFK